jgi:heat shock protein HslJ
VVDFVSNHCKSVGALRVEIYLAQTAYMRCFKFYPVFLLAFIFACKSQKSAATAPKLEGGSEELFMYQWNLTELNGKAVDEGINANLAFAPGQVSRVTGNSSCNQLNGTIELKEDHGIRFSPFAVTRMACMGVNVEAEFLKVLEQTKSWSVKNGQLQLIDGPKVVAKLNGVKPAAAIPAELQGTWVLEYITGPRIAFDGLYPDKKPTMIIKENGEFAGNTSCNGMGGRLYVMDSELKFDAPVTTMMACPGNGEQTFLKTLKDIDSYEIKEGKLLLKGKGMAMMRLVKK